MGIFLLIGRALFGSLAGQLVTLTAVAALGVWLYGAQKHAQGVKQGAAEVVATVNSQAAEQVKEAEEARKPAELPGAVLRLRQSWCRDCP